ncbi:MAG: YkvA family protein [Spirochaetales bacterium]|jgi:uncharacterized membrane protein YkvA (DUF1232 family)
MKGRQPEWYKKLKSRASRLKRQIWALYLALKDPETPWSARLFILLAIAYATSPIDLIPDFIPVLGQLDDLIVLPVLIGLALRRIPKPVMARCRREAWKRLESGERVKTAASIVASMLFVAVWLGLLIWIASIWLK